MEREDLGAELANDLTGGDDSVVYSGWLTKSPPLEYLHYPNKKQQLLKAVPVAQPKWRRRWFVLREGNLAGQYYMYYYSDALCKKLKGFIDLDQLEQVDSGLTVAFGKLKYQHMFDIKTPKRTYYLAADSEEEMLRWVDCICQVCGLKSFQDENEEDLDSLSSCNPQNQNESSKTTVTVPVKTSNVALTNAASDAREGASAAPQHISGPYMHLSDCFTGGRPPVAEAPRKPSLDSQSGCHRNRAMTSTSTLASSSTLPGRNSQAGVDDWAEDSVFLPNSPGQSSTVAASDSTREGSLAPALPPSTSAAQCMETGPRRPPKPEFNKIQPPVLNQMSGETYANHEEMQKLMNRKDPLAFRKERNNNNPDVDQSASTLQHPRPPPGQSTLSSLQQRASQQQAPQIDRRLKPKLPLSTGDSSTLTNKTGSNGLRNGPPVERKLKPRGPESGESTWPHGMILVPGCLGDDGVANNNATTLTHAARYRPSRTTLADRRSSNHSAGGGGGPGRSFDGYSASDLDSDSGDELPGGGGANGGRAKSVMSHAGSTTRDLTDQFTHNEFRQNSDDEEEQIYFFMPSLQQSQDSRFGPLMIPAQEMLDNKIQYLDLDLPPPTGEGVVGSSTSASAGSASASSVPTSTASVGPSGSYVNGSQSASRSNDESPVYKTVDFVKTEAFNRTRLKVEEKRYNSKLDQ